MDSGPSLRQYKTLPGGSAVIFRLRGLIISRSALRNIHPAVEELKIWLFMGFGILFSDSLLRRPPRYI